MMGYRGINTAKERQMGVGFAQVGHTNSANPVQATAHAYLH